MGWGRSTPLADVGGEVAIVGVGESGFSGPSGRHATQMAAEAIGKAISDAGLVPGDIDGIMYGGMLGDQFTARDFRETFATERELWESPEGGGMVWAATAPYQAAHALRSGKANYIVNSFAVDWFTSSPFAFAYGISMHVASRTPGISAAHRLGPLPAE